MKITHALAASLALAVAVPAQAALVQFDFSGVTSVENFSIPRGQAFTATAVFDTDTPKTGETTFGDSIFDGALRRFEVVIGGETLTANRPGRALQGGVGGPDGSSDFSFDLGARSPFDPVIDAIDGTITGTDGTLYDPQTLSVTILLSFAADEFLFDDVDDLLNEVEATGAVSLPSSFGVTSALRFEGGGNIDFDIEQGAFTVVDDTGGGVPVIPVPAAGWLLLAGIAGLAALRRRPHIDG